LVQSYKESSNKYGKRNGFDLKQTSDNHDLVDAIEFLIGSPFIMDLTELRVLAVPV
jgi:hypothetical protein